MSLRIVKVAKELPGVYMLQNFWDGMFVNRVGCPFNEENWKSLYEKPVKVLRSSPGFKIAICVLNTKQLNSITEGRMKALGFVRPLEKLKNEQNIYLFYLLPEPDTQGTEKDLTVDICPNPVLNMSERILNSPASPVYRQTGDGYCCGLLWRMHWIYEKHLEISHKRAMQFNLVRKDLIEKMGEKELKKRGYYTDVFPDVFGDWSLLFSSRHTEDKVKMTKQAKEIF